MVIQDDKIKHAIAGALIAVVTIWFSFGLSLLICLSVAMLKEIYDHYTNGTMDKWDVVATMAGWLPVAAILQLIIQFVG